MRKGKGGEERTERKKGRKERIKGKIGKDGKREKVRGREGGKRKASQFFFGGEERCFLVLR